MLDLVSVARTADDVYGWVTRAVGRRLTTEARLREAMELRGRLRWRRELAEALAADAAGVHSVLEHRYLRDVERPHRLPRAARQARGPQPRRRADRVPGRALRGVSGRGGT